MKPTITKLTALFDDGQREFLFKVHPSTAEARVAAKPGFVKLLGRGFGTTEEYERALAKSKSTTGHPWRHIQHPRDFARWQHRDSRSDHRSALRLKSRLARLDEQEEVA